jgi:hypothetical protein
MAGLFDRWVFYYIKWLEPVLKRAAGHLFKRGFIKKQYIFRVFFQEPKQSYLSKKHAATNQ